MDEITYRWCDGISCTDREWAAIDLILEANGWMAMNRQTSRVYLAEQDDQIVGISCLQFVPYVGPLWAEKSLRGTGMVDKLVDDTCQWLKENNARGWLVVATSPHVPKLCERHGMHRMTSPVYITDAQGQEA